MEWDQWKKLTVASFATGDVEKSEVGQINSEYFVSHK